MIIEGAIERGRFVGVRTCGSEVGVVEKTGRCDDIVFSI